MSDIAFPPYAIRMIINNHETGLVKNDCTINLIFPVHNLQTQSLRSNNTITANETSAPSSKYSCPPFKAAPVVSALKGVFSRHHVLAPTKDAQ